MSRWAAVDFDAHDGGAERARAFALRALEVLVRHPQLYLILTGSGSHGWHLFILTAEFQQIDYWTLFLKRLTTEIGAPIRPGCCELFPNETTFGSSPYAIRAPGTWNPKTDRLGLIVFNSTGPLLERLCAAKEKPKKERENSPFLYPSSVEAAGAQLNDSKAFYCGGLADWQTRFAISHGGTRHEQLRQLVHVMSRQVGYRIARRNAEAQYLAARVQPKATLSEHLEEFDSLWQWNLRHCREELSGEELVAYDGLKSETERDLFRVVRNFARLALEQTQPDFPFPIQHVALRLGITFQRISQLRQNFCRMGLISETAPARTNASAARFRWCFPFGTTNPAHKPCLTGLGATAIGSK